MKEIVVYISIHVKLCLSQPTPQIQPYGAKVRTGHPGLSLSCSPGGPLGLPKGRRLLTILVWKELVTKTKNLVILTGTSHNRDGLTLTHSILTTPGLKSIPVSDWHWSYKSNKFHCFFQCIFPKVTVVWGRFPYFSWLSLNISSSQKPSAVSSGPYHWVENLCLLLATLDYMARGEWYSLSGTQQNEGPF